VSQGYKTPNIKATFHGGNNMSNVKEFATDI
jgi:hypothetical protein